jgi:Fe-S cluster assembly protein SufB
MTSFDLDLSKYELGWSDEVEYAFTPEKGINPGVVDQISWWKGEPRWMTKIRQRSLRRFERKPMAEWFAVNMPELDFQDIYYYLRPAGEQVDEWDELPEELMRTYEKLGIPEAERQYLAGVTAQYECLRGSTQVWTTRGMRAIKELGLGDTVFSLDPETKQIVAGAVRGQACSGDKEVLEIRAGSRTIGASGNHPFLALRDRRRPGRERARYAAEWVQADDLQPGDYVAVATDLPDYGDVEFVDEICSSLGIACTEFMWHAAHFLATGSVERHADTLESFFEIHVLGAGTQTARVPDWVYAVPRAERLAFLSGLEQSDASRTSGAPSSEDIRALELLCGVSDSDLEGFPTHTSDMLGYVRIDSIESVGVEPTYDIEVEGHHNFVAEGFVVHNSEVVYHKNREDLEAQGILFCDMDTALREYPHLVKEYFGTVIPPGDNKFAALNTAVWSGGSFIYVPPGVECEMPLQAYFRINSENAGQFERTLIIADEGSQVHYIEGCSAPVYTSDSLHSAVVEIIVKPHARVTYTTIQNWSPNVYNLVTKRAKVEAHGHMEWIDGNIGSRLTMKYPAVYLVGEGATGEVLSVAYAGDGQHQDAGAKMVHAAPNTSSKIVSKSISKDGGITTYRGLVRVDDGAHGCKSHVECDALILDEDSVSKTLPYMEVGERDAQIGHEATVSKIADEQLFYLMSRGLSEEQAMGMIVNGFIEPITKTLPMEYAVEWNRLIELQMEGSVG